MTRSVRVLFVHGNLELGGAERLNIHLIAALRTLGVTADLFLIRRAGPLMEEARTLGIEPYFAVDGPGRLRGGLPRTAWLLPRIARRYDVVVGGVELAATNVAAMAGFLALRPVAGQVHIDLASPARPRGSRLTNTVARAVYPRLAVTIGVSDAATRSIRRFGARPNRCHTIANGIPLEFIRERAAEPVELEGERPILAVGRLIRQKGFDRLIGALPAVRARGLANQLLIVGDGPERIPLQRQAEALGIADGVIFVGADPNPWRYMTHASMVCFPSRFEGFGLVLAEAMALGLPVVATDDSEPVRQILDMGRLGSVVPEARLAEAIAGVLESPSAAADRASLAISAAAAMGIEATAGQYAKLFRHIATRKRTDKTRPTPAN